MARSLTQDFPYLGQAGVGVLDAPVDGKQYARKNAAWSEVVLSGGLSGIFPWDMTAVETPAVLSRYIFPDSIPYPNDGVVSPPSVSVALNTGAAYIGAGTLGTLPTTGRFYWYWKPDASVGSFAYAQNGVLICTDPANPVASIAIVDGMGLVMYSTGGPYSTIIDEAFIDGDVACIYVDIDAGTIGVRTPNGDFPDAAPGVSLYNPYVVASLLGYVTTGTGTMSSSCAITNLGSGITPPAGYLPLYSYSVTLPEGSAASDVYEVTVAGSYGGVDFSAGDLAIVRTDGSSVTRVPVSNMNTTEIAAAIAAAISGHIVTSDSTENLSLVAGSTVTEALNALKSQAESAYNAASNSVPMTELGNTVATLVSGVIPANQLPSYVDEVVDTYTTFSALLAAGSGVQDKAKIFITIDEVDTTTGLPNQYRWTGSGFVLIPQSVISSTDDLPEGATNKYFSDSAARDAVFSTGMPLNGGVAGGNKTYLYGLAQNYDGLISKFGDVLRVEPGTPGVPFTIKTGTQAILINPLFSGPVAFLNGVQILVGEDNTDALNFYVRYLHIGGDDSITENTGWKRLVDAAELSSALALKLDASSYIQHSKGKFISEAALTSAHPTATDGDYAIIDAGAGTAARQYVWDAEAGWVDSGAVKSGTTSDQLVEGSTNLFFTDTRVRDAVLTGLDTSTVADITATDKILAAFGKIQARITAIISAISGKQDTLVSGSNIKTLNGDSILGSGNITVTGGGVVNAAGAFDFVSEIIVTSPQQDIDLSGLNLDSDSEYMLKLYAVSSSTAAHAIYLYYNNDTTAANYQRYTMLGGTSNNVSTIRTSDAYILYAAGAVGSTSDVLSGTITISKAGGLKPHACCIGNSYSTSSSSILSSTNTHVRNNTENVTSIKLRHAGTFGVGTRVRLYRLTKTTSTSRAGYGQTTTLASASGVVTIDVSAAENLYSLSLTENVTSWVFTNLPSTGYYRDIYIRVTQNASVAKTVVSPASAGSTAGGAWTMSTTLSAKETLGLRIWADGSVTLFPTGVQG